MGVTGDKPPQGVMGVERVQELLADFTVGHPESYMSGVTENVKGDVFRGLTSGGHQISKKTELSAILSRLQGSATSVKYLLLMLSWCAQYCNTGHINKRMEV